MRERVSKSYDPVLELTAGWLRFRFRKQAEFRGILGVYGVSMSASAILQQLTIECLGHGVGNNLPHQPTKPCLETGRLS